MTFREIISLMSRGMVGDDVRGGVELDPPSVHGFHRPRSCLTLRTQDRKSGVGRGPEGTLGYI